MIAECVRKFLDIETGELRNEGERFEVTAERLSAINSTKYGRLAVMVEEPLAETVTEPQKPKRRTRRAKAAEE